MLLGNFKSNTVEIKIKPIEKFRSVYKAEDYLLDCKSSSKPQRTMT